MKKTLYICCFMLACITTRAQEEPGPLPLPTEQNAEFPGGNTEMKKYLDQHTCYSQAAIKAGIKGKVYIAFFVMPTGKIDSVHIKRGLHSDLDRIALAAVKNMPKWQPALYNGKPVKQKYVIPVSFSFQGTDDKKEYLPTPCKK